jgi:hypothetical protein
MFQSLLTKRATNRSYKRTVDDYLAVLFCDFPNSLLPSLRQRVGDSSLVRRGHAEGTDARVCSVQVAILLIRKIIGGLSNQDRQELAQAFLQNDASNPTYKGFKRGAVPHTAPPRFVLEHRNSRAASWHVAGSNFQLMGRGPDRRRNRPAAGALPRGSRAQERIVAIAQWALKRGRFGSLGDIRNWTRDVAAGVDVC